MTYTGMLFVDTGLIVIELYVTSSDPLNRYQAARRLSVLSSWRFQLLSQVFITDKNHRRPFKLTRGPISFVATDMGSNLFVLEEDPDELKDAKGAVLPLELRKRLTEIGWTDDDKPVDQHRERVRTPMSLLPSLHLDLLDNGSSFQSP